MSFNRRREEILLAYSNAMNDLPASLSREENVAAQVRIQGTFGMQALTLLQQSGMMQEQGPVAVRLFCEVCKALHVDEGEFAHKSHHTHACQECGAVWRPAIVPTIGVKFLPGFKNEDPMPF